ncbi:MAG TPA: MMPL family transporter, partial [Pirellulaceae bacterium]|nr:MMPL family transporter [Pirellulaceae bacterium]
LTFILSVSAGVHMTNYYKKRLVISTPDLAVGQTIRDGGRPIFLSALTTALGLFSLSSSQILPIRWFGLYSAASLMLGILPIIFLLPHVLAWVTRRWPVRSPGPDVDRRWVNRRERRMTALAMAVKRWHWAISILGLAVVIGLSWGVTRLGASVKIQDRFSKSTQIIRDYQWLEQQLGPLVPMEVVLEFDREHPLPSWQRMLLTMAVERALQTSDQINASFSAAMFRPILTGGSGSLARAADRLTRETWESQLSELKSARLVADGSGVELWRISLRIAAMNEIDYGELLDVIHHKLDEQLSLVNERMRENDQPEIRAVITGGVPMMYKAQHQVLNDLIVSFGTAFLLISVTMMLVVRSIWGGLLSMIPNVFPPLTVFGAMGWLGLKIEIGSVMTASVALGIAVDDTIHFLTWYQRSLDEGATPLAGIRQAYLKCAKSMWDSTLICSLGVAPFMLSVFMPTVRFARLMAILLFVALIGDLLVLPALLIGPGRRLFSSQKRRKNAEAGFSLSCKPAQTE